VGFSACGGDLTHLPTMCTDCYDATAEYDIDHKTYCSACEKPYVRIDGCNIMECICGAKTCHVCGFKFNDYDNHFPDGSFNPCINEGIKITKHEITHQKLILIEEFKRNATAIRTKLHDKIKSAKHIVGPTILKSKSFHPREMNVAIQRNKIQLGKMNQPQTKRTVVRHFRM